MSTETAPRLSLTHIDFAGLYTRHLGRHSQFGINVVHLIALFGIWFCIYSAVTQGARLAGLQAWWAPAAGLALAYLAAVASNASFRAAVATAAFLALFLACVLAVPALPAWSIPAFLAVIPAFYKLQSWSHRVWVEAADMTEFNRRFPPGRELNLILLLFEVPICLEYLCFRRKDWRR
ncbi:hypothetical protein [Paludisphaera mucosa]|uniref:Uncharacterized protein n=1 Tax=Paludisphaera mucosa TaxID=3030827 RepID=A0ABT6FAW3_9BACT|nr:hypothetical protein [Paludisphaera mucosa]MDG3004700.1 hypothetical protein [Paludisphaera mucosa]